MITLDIIPSHTLAQWLLTNIHHLLDIIGLSKDKNTEEILYVAIIILCAVGIGWILSNIIRLLVRKIIMVRNAELGQALVKRKVLSRNAAIIPPLVVLALIPFAFIGTSTLSTVIMRSVLIYTAIIVCMAICTDLSFVWDNFEKKRNSRNLPLRGILDTIIGILWVVTIIICVSIIVNKSPVALLTGLGAFAAVLMLVFKDSILGLVAGLQLSQNDMLHVGDWIVVPSTPANGIVIDVSLTTIKVQNWDNTIITLPPYTLISSSFQNYRGMTDSGVRQIARSVLIDTYSVKPISETDVDSLATKFPIIKNYVDKLRKNGNIFDPGLATVNGTIDTNLGLFRAYLCEWLLSHPSISSKDQILVRLMAPNEYGTPLQIWCFTSTNAWTAYEAIQSALFEHITVTAPLFGLNLYVYSSGQDALTVNLLKDSDASASPSQAQSQPQG
ncbi:MAG: mechanosensitive ion channel [Bacteroides sp.]|nr:mechanosensitive ion channel [Bacteroides sp.]